MSEPVTPPDVRPPAERWVALRVRDTVVVRDGRSFDAGGDRRGATVGPWPSTVAGALTTAFDGVEPSEVRGPVLGEQLPDGSWSPRFPVPADVLLPGNASARPGRTRVIRLRPGTAATDPVVSLVTSDLPDGPQALLLPPTGVERVSPLPGLLRPAGLRRWLNDDVPTRDGTLDVEAFPLVPDVRVGLARSGRVAAEGYLYSMTHLRPRDGWAFLVQCDDSPGTRGVTPAGPVPLGGRARLADCADAPGVAWPDRPGDYPGGRLSVYVATPAVWADGWRPPLPPGARLVAAAVPDPVPVATASPRRARERIAGGPTPGPRGLRSTASLRWAVPPGAVYLLRFEDDPATGRDGAECAARWAATVHGRALGPSADVAPDGTDRLRTAGFGVILTGRWSEAAAHDPGSSSRQREGMTHDR
jgi:CRISPR-associated protein Cmr3